MNMTVAPPSLMLSSHCLLSKWGFGDGDLPDHLWDYMDELGWDGAGVDWHPALRLLVRRHLLPVLDQQVEVYDIETSHNPIRVESVDGVEIDCHESNKHITLTPEHVVVSWEQIETAIRETT